uniref:Family with sequence similarity 117 member A n=1 Tax=Rousettus aegyptiacus TaxID=9407 RepID=A0A7J8G7L0_ROUAE|nr:family with sequence similarity 117 member A [Rousettus aegyptiacus]
MGTVLQLPPRVAAVITPSSSWSLATLPALPPSPWHPPSLLVRPATRNTGVQSRSWHPSPVTKPPLQATQLSLKMVAHLQSLPLPPPLVPIIATSSNGSLQKAVRECVCLKRPRPQVLTWPS